MSFSGKWRENDQENLGKKRIPAIQVNTGDARNRVEGGFFLAVGGGN